MMWFDRITGRKMAQLPEDIESSRYVATKTVLVNGHSEIGPGALLVDDGSGEFRGVEATSFFRRAEQSEDTLVEHDIVSNVLLEFEDDIKSGKKPSFLIPEVLLDRLHLQPFDTVIKETIERGHFHEISRSPMMELIYQEHLLPIGRVKRFSASAGRHLAAHSECWQKRSFSGVVPRSLLALESEDEYNIYENRVYARLLDHLDRYLQRRCREVSRIEEAIDEAASFEASDELFYGLIHSVCSLWGEGFQANQVEADEAKQGQGTLQILRSLLREVRGLRSSELYRAVPKGDDIGSQIRMTNTLSHDQHYRHVARLWHLWLDYSSEGRVDPEVKFESNTHYAEAYFTYTEALVKRSLEELGGIESDNVFVMPGGRTVKISTGHYIINLELSGMKLSFVPVYDQLNSEVKRGPLPAQQSTIALTPANMEFDLSSHEQAASPFYFYILEAMTSRISSWISLDAISVLDNEISKLPSAVTRLLSAKYSEYFTFKGTGARLRIPLGELLLSAIRHEFKSTSRDTSVSRFLISLDRYSAAMDGLLACPLCGSITGNGDFHPRDDGAFEASGSSCKHFWRIDKDKTSHRFFVAGPIEDNGLSRTDISFTHYGRFSYQFELPQLNFVIEQSR